MPVGKSKGIKLYCFKDYFNPKIRSFFTLLLLNPHGYEAFGFVMVLKLVGLSLFLETQ